MRSPEIGGPDHLAVAIHLPAALHFSAAARGRDVAETCRRVNSSGITVGWTEAARSSGRGDALR
jgi:hypothetical protein